MEFIFVQYNLRNNIYIEFLMSIFGDRGKNVPEIHHFLIYTTTTLLDGTGSRCVGSTFSNKCVCIAKLRTASEVSNKKPRSRLLVALGGLQITIHWDTVHEIAVLFCDPPHPTSTQQTYKETLNGWIPNCARHRFGDQHSISIH
ncbi:hypothetical protein EGR_03366 [Echinococcus granulosus]|uniref:Uncharacterized protein n=1 Tax=Echinococcus granulosus TaxID=6210 RepID=W6UJU9_ECHGR|nr:hypothetical protein EGR_03366 [Echinococcus granulosus]EUB61820.1 hypothetical protein EGR_03366 [Echinococcus granulosus]